jgi:hypothetical protein
MKTSKIEKIKLAAKAELNRAVFGSSFDNGYAVILGDHLFVQSEVVEWNMHRYSKAWHRAHGGAKEVSCRKITIYSYHPRKKQKLHVAAVVRFDAWRGNILLTAIKNSGLFVAPESTAPMSVRLDKFYSAEIIRTIGHIKIYERKLLGGHIDYCAVLNGVTFHADSIRAAVRGVHVKIKAAAKRQNSPINLKLCKELGFCDAGIKQFCNVFNIDIKGSYTPDEIEALVRSDLDKAAPFEHELRTVAKTIGYQSALLNNQ